MNKSILLTLVALFVLSFAAPVAAQPSPEQMEKAICIKVNFSLSAGEEYLYGFLYPEQLKAVMEGNPDPAVIAEFNSIKIAEQDEHIDRGIIIVPMSTVIIGTGEDGGVVVLMDESGAYGISMLIPGPPTDLFGQMDVDCLGAATDGRLNRFDQHMLAVIYHDGAGGYNVLWVDAATNEGTFDYNVTRAQINDALAAADSSGEPQVIASGKTSTLYALGNGECQLNSPSAHGEMQEFIFNCA